MTRDQELEVKYLIADLPAQRIRLESLGAVCVQPRTFEQNLRFDTPDGRLTHTYQVLRLRQDQRARLTYKGPGEERDGVRLRREIEFEVDDFEAARRFLEALGYRVSVRYEKYRTTYDLGATHITLDELPYGDFLEIEGPTPREIRAVSDELGLRWDARIRESYLALFQRARLAQGWPFTDLVFSHFAQIQAPLAPLGLPFADK